ncbi:putative necrosis-inducing factor-domain-containing protein [Triangularia verruculosa]|uniref:Necrosis-inducing factor-domain-containing protein n=1 Tax=Triangularia verruculosa TaxID=2587418 RepID=A0AAN7AUI1_9PEZI|nr:putative necrosis-inducing factor-domain-containing protein [Triangularia verruculosa]
MQLTKIAVAVTGLVSAAEATKNCQTYTASVKETSSNSPPELDCYAVQASGEDHEYTVSWKGSDGQKQVASSGECNLSVLVNGADNEVAFGNQDVAEVTKLAIEKFKQTLDGVLRVGGQGTMTCNGVLVNWAIN